MREIADAILVIGVVFLVGMFVLYFNAFRIEIRLLFTSNEGSSDIGPVVFESRDGDLGGVEFEELLTSDHKVVTSNVHTYDLVSYLDASIAHYSFPFTTLPPGRRLLINAGEVSIDAPIVDVPYASKEKLELADFNEELKRGVVKYPSTPSPDEDGKMLVFGHSSVATYQSIKNPFGFIFYHLPKLVSGDNVEIWRDGKLYSYTIADKIITNPDEVADYVKQNGRKGERSLVMMACYPLFSTAQRILVRAESDAVKRNIYSYVGKTLNTGLDSDMLLAFTSPEK